MDQPTYRSATAPAELNALRREIDDLDRRILDLLARRFECARSTLDVKARHGLPASDTRREAEVVRTAAARARESGLEPELVREIFWRVIELSRQAQDTPVGCGAAR